jgi:2-iminobutanoate/2-iminopropanoate deaminase
MSHHREIVKTDSAPSAIGPYNQAVVAGNFVFVSGQVGFDPRTGILVEGGIREQTHRALTNLGEILRAAGSSIADVTACTVYLQDMNDFAQMNEVYATFFTTLAPSRATVEVSRLPKDSLVEISCIAVKA